MTQNKRLLSILTVMLIAIASYAGNGVNSPYSRYGLGLLSNQNLAINRQMGGLGYAMGSNYYINLLNPASIVHIDSLTMLFEAGLSIQNGNFKENGKSINARNASFDYIAAQFRIRKNLGMSLGYLPYSDVGYSFSNSQTTPVPGSNTNITSTNSYNGSGGIYQPFIGIGWSPVKNLSVGLMASYIYGDISHSVTSTFSDANFRSRARNYEMTVRSYKLDFGAQYKVQLHRKHSVTLGAVYSLGHDLNADATMIEQTINNSILEHSDTISLGDGFKLPHTFGAGIAYNFNNNLKIGADYTLQKWSDATFFDGNKGVDRNKISVGAEYTPGKYGNILKQMYYRAGAYYADPYTQINGKEGCREWGVSAGISIPIRNGWNNSSMIHISGEFVKFEPKTSGMISETYLRLSVGITFNETWFTKMRIY